MVQTLATTNGREERQRSAPITTGARPQALPRPLRILLVEDSPDDAALTARFLGRDGLDVDVSRVATRDELVRALEGNRWDAVVSDDDLPRLDALDALQVVRDLAPDLPFVVVCGGIREERAIEAMRAGADDYVLQSSLEKLPLALERTLAAAATRRELTLSATRFQRLIEHLLDVVCIVGADGTIRYESPVVKDVFGYSPSDLVGRSVFELVHPDDAVALGAALSFGQRETHSRELLGLRVKHEDGSWHDIEASVLNLLGDPAVRGYVIAARDVSEQRRLEAQLRQAQRLESVGLLAGGIAHDFNNLLSIIMGYSTLLRTRLAGTQSQVELAEIQEASRRAAELTRQLLAFARQQVLKPTAVDLAALLEQLQPLLRRLISENIELDLTVEPGLGAILADPGQVEQVVLNLVVNARDAIGTKPGRILIGAGKASVCQEAAEPEPLQIEPGAYAVLTVSDTGCGIGPADAARIFEPFFTTKPVGAGSGLGLSTVYGIASQSGGTVVVESEPGAGATFRVYFPQIESGRAPAAEPSLRRRASRRRTATVMLVEDEPSVRTLVAELLRGAGHTVVEFGRPDDALAWASEGNEVGLLVSDVVMPVMSGVELAERLAAHEPNAKHLFVSGYPRDEIGGIDAGHLLQKPFEPDELLAAVDGLVGDGE